MFATLASLDTTPDIANAINMALAPVFLFSGVAAMLNVMAGRLSRIIDRGRYLTEMPSTTAAALYADRLATELNTLERRRRFASAAITVCTLSALLVCLVIAILFLEVLLDIHLKWLVGVLFISSTVALVIGLAFFLREVHLANLTVRIELREAASKSSDST